MLDNSLLIPIYGNSYRHVSGEGIKMELPRERILAIKYKFNVQMLLTCLLKTDGI